MRFAIFAAVVVGLSSICLADSYKPVVIMLTSESCAHCVVADKRLDKVDDLPFVVVKVDISELSEEEQEKVSLPTFRWYSAEGKHCQVVGDDITSKRFGLLDRWKYSMRNLVADD